MFKEAAEIRGNTLPDINDHLVAPAGGSYVTKPKTLQGALSEVVDKSCFARLLNQFTHECAWPHVRRLNELRDASTSHDWISCLNVVFSPVLALDEYATAIKIRLGIVIIEDPIVCPNCSSSELDVFGLHALCCAKSIAT